MPVVMLFISAALIFAPSIFRTVGGTLYGDPDRVGGVDGIEPF